ncbi:MAG: aspartyl/asparaginyl beta-hydroxylase domain-containing protein [Sphingomicrobium sp.]
MDADTLIGQAESALGKGDLPAASQLLERAAAERSDDPSLWLRIAGLHRATGKPRLALEAVHHALRHAPLEFTALLMRATLLDKLGEAEAPEAWEQALANKPAGELPPQLAAIVAQGERRHSEWVAAREAKMKSATMEIEARADPLERKHIERFRNNVLRRTRPFHSTPTHFHFPELAEREFHPRELFAWLGKVEAQTHKILAEFEAVMNAERAELVPYIQYAEHLPLDQWRALNKNSDWTAIHLLLRGKRNEANARNCPATLALLGELPQPHVAGASPNAMFSLLAPHTAIPPHVGISNARLVCHLPLVVPEGCWFRVGAETRSWKPGEAFVFDDTIEHEAMNPSDELRVVFIFDLWHPDLSSVEREAVASLIGASGIAGDAL